MYAVVKVGGKQERVHAGDVIDVEFIKKMDPGETVDLQPLLIVDDDGRPHGGPKALSKAKVVARLLGEKKGDKIKVFKYRNKSRYQRSQGHRQLMTQIEIEEIALSPDRVARKPEVAPEKEPEVAKKPTGKKTPAKKPAAKKPPARKTPAKKTAAKKAPAKNATAKKAATKKSPAQKTATKEPTTRKKT